MTIKELLLDIKKAVDKDKSDEMLKEALDKALSLEKEDSDRLYKVWYHQMGAFVFEEMILKEEF